MALSGVVYEIFNVEKYRDLKIRVRGQSRSLKAVPFDRLDMADHVSSLLASYSRLLYALRVLRGHGIPAASTNDVFRSTVGAGFKGPRGPGPQASHQQSASHQTRRILFVVHASCLQNDSLTHSLTHSLQKTEDILIQNP